MYLRVTKPFAGALRPLDLHAGIHISSVHPELGSNSQNIDLLIKSFRHEILIFQSENLEERGSLSTPVISRRAIINLQLKN